MKKLDIKNILLPFVGVLVVLGIWAASSATWAPTLPSPLATWEASKLYIMEPFEKRGELDQGILRFTWYSLQRVVKGYSIAILIGAPLGFMLGMIPEVATFLGAPLDVRQACQGTATAVAMMPTLAPELKIPVASARSRRGNHSATDLIPAG